MNHTTTDRLLDVGCAVYSAVQASEAITHVQVAMAAVESFSTKANGISSKSNLLALQAALFLLEETARDARATLKSALEDACIEIPDA